MNQTLGNVWNIRVKAGKSKEVKKVRKASR